MRELGYRTVDMLVSGGSAANATALAGERLVRERMPAEATITP